MSIRIKLTVIFLALVTVPLLFVSLLTITNYEHSLETSRLLQMQDLARFKAERIEDYFKALRIYLETAQSFYNIKIHLPILLRSANDPGLPEVRAAQKALGGQLVASRQVLELADILLTDNEGKLIFAGNPEQAARNFPKPLAVVWPEAFAAARNGIYFSDIFMNKQSGNKPEMLIIAPIYDFNDKRIGRIVFEVDMAPVYRLIQDRTGLGDSGEIVIGKKTGREFRYLSPLRSGLVAFSTMQIAIGSGIALPMQKAVQGETGIGQSVDYRGEKVIAAWQPIPSLGWGLVAKIDSSEAFAGVINLRRLVIMILGIVFVLAAIIVFSVTESIARPIKMLSRGAEIIGGGNLDHRVGTDMKDEIGRLSRTFDKMTHDLKATTASRDELNREMAERKRTEEAWRESEERLSRAQEIAHLGSWELDLVNDKLSWSDEVYRIFGFEPGEFDATYEAFLDAVHPDDRAAVDEAYSASLRENRDTYEIEHRVVRKNSGEIRFVHEKCRHFRGGSGEIIRSIGMVHDITDRKQAEQALRESEERFRIIAEASPMQISVSRAANGIILFTNPEYDRVFGFAKGELIGRQAPDLYVDPEDRVNLINGLREKGFLRNYEVRVKKADGTMFWVSASVSPIQFGGAAALLGTALDITERKQAEEKLQRAHAELEKRVQERTAELVMINKELAAENAERKRAEEALRAASLYARNLIEASIDPLVTISAEGRITDVNQATELATGVSREQLISSNFAAYFTEPQKADEGYRRVFTEGWVKDYPLTIRHLSGRLIDVLYNAVVYKNTTGEIQGVFAAARDITKRKAAEERQSITNALLELFVKKSSRKAYLDSTVEIIRHWSACEFVGIRIKDDNGNIPYEAQAGFDEDFLASESGLHLEQNPCICVRTITVQPQPQEQRFMSGRGSFFCNDSLEFFNSLSAPERAQYRGICMRRGFQSLAVVPLQYQGKVFGAIHLADFQKDKVLPSKIEFIETTIAPLIGEAVQYFNAEAELEKYRQNLEELVQQRTTELENANRDLQFAMAQREKMTEDLARSNKDLEQFAYVASHDLQEPLRAVAGFVELLKRKLQDRLDDKQKEYMRFIVEGAGRMQALINGLLEYSRIETRAKALEPIQAATALEQALLNLQASIKESGIKITAGPLPTVYADSLQLTQLFQNLIGNAVKFRAASAPEVRIRAEPENGAWRFIISDNGIGIDTQYIERIFLIFQRLHTRREYPGTGIGLAICKKIVERHGGRIWVESTPGCGSNFYFTIPNKGEISA